MFAVAHKAFFCLESPSLRLSTVKIKKTDTHIPVVLDPYCCGTCCCLSKFSVGRAGDGLLLFAGTRNIFSDMRNQEPRISGKLHVHITTCNVMKISAAANQWYLYSCGQTTLDPCNFGSRYHGDTPPKAAVTKWTRLAKRHARAGDTLGRTRKGHAHAYERDTLTRRRDITVFLYITASDGQACPFPERIPSRSVSPGCEKN